MEQLTRHISPRYVYLIGILLLFGAVVIATQLPVTTAFLPLIAYCSYRLYTQLQHETLDHFNVFFEVGCMLASVTLFITAHTVLY